jgi:hypothetical protein
MSEHDRQASTTSTVAEPAAAARTEPRSAASVLLALQSTAGNRAVNALLQRRRPRSNSQPRRRRIQRRPLVESDYASLTALRKDVKIVQTPGHLDWGGLNEVPAKVEVSTPTSPGANELSMGTVGQAELSAAAAAGVTEQAALAWEHPEIVRYQGALAGIQNISYVRRNVSGSAIGRIADLMAANITHRPPRPNTTARTREAIKNMFLHVFGQAIITTIWGRGAADFAGDIHERDQPALIVGGKLTPAAERQAIDNYCDLINNVHGQAWGEALSKSLSVDGNTVWTPVMVALYANELQKYVAKSMGWTMKAIPPTDPEITRFSNMLNEVVHGTAPPAPAAPAATP